MRLFHSRSSGFVLVRCNFVWFSSVLRCLFGLFGTFLSLDLSSWTFDKHSAKIRFVADFTSMLCCSFFACGLIQPNVTSTHSNQNSYFAAHLSFHQWRLIDFVGFNSMRQLKYPRQKYNYANIRRLHVCI